MSRPSIYFQRLVVPPNPVGIAAPNDGPITQSDPTFWSADEAIQVDYLFVDAEAANADDIGIRPSMRERQYWVPVPVPPSAYNNYARVTTPSVDYGEFVLAEPFLVPRGQGMGITMENRIVGPAGEGLHVDGLFVGEGRESGRDYSLRIRCALPPGAADPVTGVGPRQDYGGRDAQVSGSEDVWIKSVGWAALPGGQGFNPRRIGMLVTPGYGTEWSGPLGGGAGGILPPLLLYSNLRGPEAAMFYRPPEKLILEQGDILRWELFSFTPNNGTVALLGLVGKTVAV